MQKISIIGFLATACASAAWGHHGFGRFEMNTDVEFSGTLTGVDLVNPHSYMNFDVVGPNGEPFAMRCEMRAAMLIRRMGWSDDMFVRGLPIEIQGHPHRDDPHSCYLEAFTLGDAPTIDRNDLFTSDAPVDTSNRPPRLASGVPNITGDWAVEQAILTIPPSGGNGALVPKSVRQAYAAGEITLEEIRARSPAPSRPVYTAAGQTAADAFEMWSPADNPRLSCQATSIIFDWTFDWPINRIEQTTTEAGDPVIDIDYGLYSFARRILLATDSHPANLEPSNAGHSIGRWEDDTLVVDTVGFAAGVLVPPTRNSTQLHIVERFTFDPENTTITRRYTAEDPVYLAEPYTGQDTVLLSETPFERHPCEELTYEFTSAGDDSAP
jgi:hypothetical protein